MKVKLGIMVLVAAGFSQAALVTDNLVIHLDAGVGVTTDASGYVSAWGDQAALGGVNSPAMGNTALQPLLVQNAINGKPAVRFDGVDDWMRLSDNLTGGELDTDTVSVFVVFKADQTNAKDQSLFQVSSIGVANGTYHYGAWWDGNNVGNEKLLFHSRDAAGGFVGSGNEMPASGVLDSGYMMMSGFWRADDTVDSSLDGTAGSVGSGADSSGDFYRLWLGSNGAGVQNLDGDIAEILIYNSALGATDQAAVEDYLSTKYTIPEPTSMLLLVLGAGGLVSLRRQFLI